MPGVFLSYSRKDSLFVRELHRRLTRDGVTCFFDQESIEWGANWVLTLEKAIDTCEFFVPILSPAFMQSKWVELESTSALTGDPAGPSRKTLPLLLTPCDVPSFLKPIQTIDVSTAALFESNYPKICGAFGGAVRPVPTRSAIPPVTPLRPPFHMPFRSLESQFVGRVDALWTVFDQLSHGQTSIVQGVGVVYGAGGLGKTQLAVEYVHRFNLHYPGGVFWVEADQGIPRLINVLSASAEIEVDGRQKEPDQLATIWTALTRRPAILLVLDNFPETVPIAPWLPPAGDIHVLVTTRRRDLTRYPRLTLPVLTPEEGQRLLNRFDTEARALVEDVGGLPLALELLRAYLETTPGITPADLRRAIQETGAIPQLARFAADYRDDLPTQHERNVAATFQLSWSLASEDARDVLHVMSHLAPTPVPPRLIRAALGWPEAASLDDRFFTARKDLWRLSLIDLDPQNQPSAHRLLLGFVRYLADGDSRWLEVVTAIETEMDRAFDEQDTASYRELEAVLPHAEAVLSRPHLPVEQRIDIVGAVGAHHQTLGRFQLAKPFLWDAAEWAGRAYPEGHAEVAVQQSNLALLLRDLGELAEARDLLRKALASDKLSYPPGDPQIAIDQSNLALVLQALNESADARELLRNALASDEHSFPAGHPYIAIDQSSLAMVLKDLGELTEAKAMLRKALSSDELSYPAGHPYIAIRQSNLAMVLKDLGELTEAQSLLRAALASDKRSFPEGHPSIASRQTNLAMVLKDLSEFPEARNLAQEAYASTLAQFGSDHPRTLTMKANLDSLFSPTS